MSINQNHIRSIDEAERFIKMCTYIDPDTMSIGGTRKAAEGIVNSANDLGKLALRLDVDEIEILLEWIVDGLKDIGLEHPSTCLMNRPHSHSADCDCGRDELQEKILKILKVKNK